MCQRSRMAFVAPTGVKFGRGSHVLRFCGGSLPCPQSWLFLRQAQTSLDMHVPSSSKRFTTVNMETEHNLWLQNPSMLARAIRSASSRTACQPPQPLRLELILLLHLL